MRERSLKFLLGFFVFIYLFVLLLCLEWYEKETKRKRIPENLPWGVSHRAATHKHNATC